MPEDFYETLTYVNEDGPDVKALKKCYDETVSELSYYFHQCRTSHDDRRNYWPGKSYDQRKGGADAFPWQGASDIEANVIEEKISDYVSLFSAAVNGANIRAYPVEEGDMGRSRVVSSFMKWMVSSYIKDFEREMEQGGNYLLEKGLMVTYVGWHQEYRSFQQKMSFQEIAQSNPEFAEISKDKENDKDVIALLQQFYPDLTNKRARKALSDLRKKGSAILPVSRKQVDRPSVQALAPDSDVFLPPWCIDPQRAPYIHWRTFLTAQEIENRVKADEWDADWAAYVIENLRGTDTLNLNDEYSGISTSPLGRYESNDNDLYSICYTYQRLIDQEDGSEGIYCTVWATDYSGGAYDDDGKDIPAYAKYELLNGYEDYPFVITRLSNDQKRLYDIKTFADHLRGTQYQVKAERDSRIDRSSLATLPPILHPAGRPPPDWGPGRFVPYYRKDEIDYGPTPQLDAGSIEIEQTLIDQANRLVGLQVDRENPLTVVKQQYYVNKFLKHCRDVLKMAYKCYQRFGPDELFFRVSGTPDPIKMGKGDPDEDFDVMISYDVLSNDPDSVESRLQQFVQLLAMDRNGKINPDRLLEVMANSISPALADAVLQPSEEAQREVTKKVMDDLTKIYSGLEVGAQPNGAQIAMQVVGTYAQQPDVAERLQNDEAFAERIQKYMEQYQFQLQQMQNAVTGRIGTAPADFQGANQ